MEKDEFGDRMKYLERMYTGLYVPISDVLCVRIDGKRFSKFTKKFAKPFDIRIKDAMAETAKYLTETTNANIGYVQSDEITLIYTPSDEQKEYMFGGKVSKINSILASQATAFFNNYIQKHKMVSEDDLAFFDCRAWGVSNIGEAANVLLWRIQDCRKNSVSCLYRWTAGHSNMKDKSQQEMIDDLLSTYNVNWADLEYYYKYGTIFKRELTEVTTEHGPVLRRKMTTHDPHDFLEVFSFDERKQYVMKVERKQYV